MAYQQGGYKRGGTGGAKGSYDNTNKGGSWLYAPGATPEANPKPTAKGKLNVEGTDYNVSVWFTRTGDADLDAALMEVLSDAQAYLESQGERGKSKPLFTIAVDKGDGGGQQKKTYGKSGGGYQKKTYGTREAPPADDADIAF